MARYFVLIIGILMFLGFIIYKIYKLRKYSLKVEAEIIKKISLPYDNYAGGYGSDGSRGINDIPVYKYRYNGLVYHYNNGSTLNSGIKKGETIKIRINPNKPEKAYVTSFGMSFLYLFFNAIVLLIGFLALLI